MGREFTWETGNIRFIFFFICWMTLCDERLGFLLSLSKRILCMILEEEHRLNRSYHCRCWGYRIVGRCDSSSLCHLAWINSLQWALEKAPSNSPVSHGSAKVLAALQAAGFLLSSLSFFISPTLHLLGFFSPTAFLLLPCHLCLPSFKRKKI